MFDRIKSFLLGLFKTYHIEQITGIKTNISAEMADAITLWYSMMTGDAPWNDKAPPCGVLDQIAGQLGMTIDQELNVETENPAIKPVMDRMDADAVKIIQYITLLGSSLLRPVYSNGKLQYEIIPLGNYLPTSYYMDGTLTGAIILKRIENGKQQFLLTENHTYANNAHTVEAHLYLIKDGCLRPAQFTDCPQTCGITPMYTWQNVSQPMIVEFRSNIANTIDNSDVPCALIYKSVDLIKKADQQFERMNWEQEAGEMRLFADRDMFQKRQGRDGKTERVNMDASLNRLILQVNGDGSDEGKKITEHAPALRTESQNAMLQQIFRRIELTCNIGKGTISDMESVQQTATQFAGGKKAFYSIIDTLESELENKYQLAANIFAYMAAAYGIGANDPSIRVTYNDMTRKDPQQQRTQDSLDVANGLMNKWEYRMKYYGETEEEAKKNVPEDTAATSPFGM
jgi:A118 family predicted phage portal protein